MQWWVMRFSVSILSLCCVYILTIINSSFVLCGVLLLAPFTGRKVPLVLLQYCHIMIIQTDKSWPQCHQLLRLVVA